MWSSYRGHVETVRVLMKYKADPNIPAAIVSFIFQLSRSLEYYSFKINFVVVVVARKVLLLSSWPVDRDIMRW